MRQNRAALLGGDSVALGGFRVIYPFWPTKGRVTLSKDKERDALVGHERPFPFLLLTN